MANNFRNKNLLGTIVVQTRVERIVKQEGESVQGFTDRVNGAMQRINSGELRDAEFVDWTDWMQDGYGHVVEVVIHVAEVSRTFDVLDEE